jgi:hypothetical protein
LTITGRCLFLCPATKKQAKENAAKTMLPPALMKCNENRQGRQIKTLTRKILPEGFSLNDYIALARFCKHFIIHVNAGPPPSADGWLPHPRKLFLNKKA